MKFDLSHYDIAYYAKKKEQYEKGQAWKIEPFFYELDVEGKTVLDYGSAAGNMAKEAVKRNAKAVAAYDPIYDNHPEIVELIHSEGIDFLTTEKLRSVHDKFDLIFCSDVIEHVTPEEVDAFVADLVRFANAKSIICVNSPVKINLAFLVGRPLASETQGHINRNL
ncbi:class I SAM-dependent methyltransferase [candidate division KSB1 bacterium]|nr:class I SAM-dependent methyltransferase [candidate division KSB1 bacterium]